MSVKLEDDLRCSNSGTPSPDGGVDCGGSNSTVNYVANSPTDGSVDKKDQDNKDDNQPQKVSQILQSSNSTFFYDLELYLSHYIKHLRFSAPRF